QLLHFRGHRYRYDEHGRTQTKQTIGATQHYHYDAEHRLSEVRIEQADRSQRYGYVYDALGRRIEKHQLDNAGNPCNRTRFLWDGLKMIQETGTNQHSSLYIYTDQSSYEPLARIDKRGNDPEKVMYFHTDLNGCPEELTDESGKILWECSFQLWGKRIHEIEHIPIQQNLRYQGQYLDRETGLHYNTFRYYDPDIGRFTQPDPIGLLGGFNLYQYAPNGLTWVDSLGLSGENVFIHYTNLAGLEGIQNTGIIEKNIKGKVYITDILMPPKDVMTNIFLDQATHSGRGDYAIVFKVNEAQMANIKRSSELEFYHTGKIKLESSQIIHIGKNPYERFNSLKYDKRLKMMQNQLKARGSC
ncbi:RHS repeat domain-containing protein, partial [Snodgrassella alvi]